MHMCANAHFRPCIHTYIPTYIHTYMHTTDVCILCTLSVYEHEYVYMQICIYIYIYICMQLYACNHGMDVWMSVCLSD